MKISLAAERDPAAVGIGEGSGAALRKVLIVRILAAAAHV